MTVHPAPADELVAFMHRLADASATQIMPSFRSDLVIGEKSGGVDFDPVTEADRAAEHVIRNQIQAAYADHAILGEEHGPQDGAAPYRWVIDPIDGTRAFILGLPTWGTLIGLEIDDKPRIGMMNQPFTNDRLWSDGEASYFRSTDGIARRIHTRQSVRLVDAQMACTTPAMFKAGYEARAYEAVLGQVRSCRYGTDCFGYALLAAGLVDLVVEADLKPYDVVALIPIIEIAGGIITTWDGEEARHGGRIIAAANPELHAEALALIATAATSNDA